MCPFYSVVFLEPDCVGTCFLITLDCVPLPLTFTLFNSCQVTLVICAVFISVSGVMSGEGANLLGQELHGACRGVDGWQGDVKDQFIHQGREVVVSFLPQEAGEVGALCDGDWHSLSVAFFSYDVAHDDRAVRAHPL